MPQQGIDKKYHYTQKGNKNLMINAVQKRARNVLLILFGLLLGVAGFSMPNAVAAPVADIVLCGFNDPAGGCAGTLAALGYINGEVVTPYYPADLNPFGPGMEGSTAAGLPGVLAAIDDFQGRGYFVRLHGYSQGSDLAIAAANERQVGQLNLYGSPHIAMGFFHSTLVEDVIGPGLQTFGKLTTDRPIPTNTEVRAFYNEGDVWSNYVPDQWDPIQTINKLNDTLAMDGHWIQPAGSATCVFTDRFGVVNFVTPDENEFTHNGCQV